MSLFLWLFIFSVDADSIIVLLENFAFLHFEHILRGCWKAAFCSGVGLDLSLMKLLVRVSAEFTGTNTEVYVY